jgi:antitoxin ParD1/3/4
MNIYLGKHFEDFIREQVESGRYANASEVVREALRRQEIYEIKLERLRAKIVEAEASFERGEGIEITDLDAYFEDLKQRVIKRSQQSEAESVNARKAS